MSRPVVFLSTILICLISATLLAATQPLADASSDNLPETLSLAEAVSITLSQNRELATARYEEAASRYSTREAWSAYLPQVNYNSQYTDSFSGTFDIGQSQTGGQNGEFDPDEFGFQGARFINQFELRQLIFDRGVIGNIRLSNLQQDAAYWQQIGQQQVAISDTVQAYLDVLRAQELLAVQKQRLALAEEQLRTAELNFEVGLRIKTDVLRAELTRSSAERDVVSAEKSVERALTRLNRILGVDLKNRFTLETQQMSDYDPDEEVETMLNNYDHLFNIATQENPAVQVADIMVSQKQESINIAQGEFYPVVDFTGSYGFNDQGSLDLETEEWRLQVAGTIPLYEGGRRGAKIKRTQKQLSAQQMRYENTVRQILNNVEVSALTLSEEKQNLEIAIKAAEVAAENHERFLNLYEEGLADSLDVTQALTELVSARTDVVTARYNYMQVYTQLIESLGIIPVHRVSYEDIAWLDLLNQPVKFADKEINETAQTVNNSEESSQ